MEPWLNWSLSLKISFPKYWSLVNELENCGFMELWLFIYLLGPDILHRKPVGRESVKNLQVISYLDRCLSGSQVAVGMSPIFVFDIACHTRLNSWCKLILKIFPLNYMNKIYVILLKKIQNVFWNTCSEPCATLIYWKVSASWIMEVGQDSISPIYWPKAWPPQQAMFINMVWLSIS